MNEVIFDANFLVAILDERDIWHSKAVTLLNTLLIALVSQEMGVSYLVSFDRDFDEIAWLKRVTHEEC